MKKISIKLIVLIGILIGASLYLIAPALGNQFRYKTLLDSKAITISEESNFTIQKAYNYSFSLAENQMAYIKFGVHYINSTVVFMILGQGQYNSFYAENKSSSAIAPNFGRWYFISTPNIWYDPQTSYTSNNQGQLSQRMVLANDDIVNIEFMGDGSSTNIWSEPGIYQIVIFGNNTSHFPSDTFLSFDLNVRVTGSGKTVEAVFSTIGILFLIASGVVALIFLFKIQEGGNSN